MDVLNRNLKKQREGDEEDGDAMTPGGAAGFANGY
jgi:hypothetical protein